MGVFLKITLLLILGVLASEVQSRCTGNKSRFCYRRFEKYCSPAQSTRRSGRWVQANCCELCGKKSVDGNWSEWKGWSPCTATCGGGRQVRTRTCTHPAPANGGLTCRGINTQSQSCSTKPCSAPVSQCKDVNVKCKTWARTGECFRNQKWMMKNCQKSCSNCPDVCEDNVNVRSKCPGWAAKTECIKNAKWMTIYCRKSCDKCVKKPAPAAPVGPTPFDSLCVSERTRNKAQCTITSQCIGNGMTNYTMTVLRPSKYTYSMWRTENNKCGGAGKVTHTSAVKTAAKKTKKRVYTYVKKETATVAAAAAPVRPVKTAATSATPFDNLCATERKRNKAQCTITSQCIGNGMTNYSMTVLRPSKYTYSRWRTEHTKCVVGAVKTVVSVAASAPTRVSAAASAPRRVSAAASAPRRVSAARTAAQGTPYDSICKVERSTGAECNIVVTCVGEGMTNYSLTVKRKDGYGFYRWKTAHTGCVGGKVKASADYEAICAVERQKGSSCEIYKDCETNRRMKTTMVIKAKDGAESTKWKVDIQACDLGPYNSMCNDERRKYESTCTITTECQARGMLKTSVAIKRKDGYEYSRWRTDYTNCRHGSARRVVSSAPTRHVVPAPVKIVVPAAPVTQPKPSKPASKIMGSVYTNAGGTVSYHFDSPQSSYISYADAPTDWVLENGDRFPTKKYFTNILIDEEGRVFKGDIIWYPTSVKGAQLWSYQMKFADDMKSIKSGKYDHYATPAKKKIVGTSLYGVTLHYKRTSYGSAPAVINPYASICYTERANGHECKLTETCIGNGMTNYSVVITKKDTPGYYKWRSEHTGCVGGVASSAPERDYQAICAEKRKKGIVCVIYTECESNGFLKTTMETRGKLGTTKKWKTKFTACKEGYFDSLCQEERRDNGALCTVSLGCVGAGMTKTVVKITRKDGYQYSRWRTDYTGCNTIGPIVEQSHTSTIGTAPVVAPAAPARKVVTQQATASMVRKSNPYQPLCDSERENNGADCRITTRCVGNGMTNYSLTITRADGYSYYRWRNEHTGCSGVDPPVAAVVVPAATVVVAAAPVRQPPRPAVMSSGTPYDSLCEDERRLHKSQCNITVLCVGKGMTNYSLTVLRPAGYGYYRWRQEYTGCDGYTPPAAAPAQAQAPKRAPVPIASGNDYEAICASERNSGGTCMIYTECQNRGMLKTTLEVKRKDGGKYTKWKTEWTDCKVGFYDSACNDEIRKGGQCRITVVCQAGGMTKTTMEVTRKDGSTFSRWRTDHTGCSK